MNFHVKSNRYFGTINIRIKQLKNIFSNINIQLYIRNLNYFSKMAVINNIRKRSGLILTFVGIGLLAFIIPVDKIMQLFNEEQSGGIGLFDNEEINSQEWNYEFRLMNSQNRARQNSKESGGEGRAGQR